MRLAQNHNTCRNEEIAYVQTCAKVLIDEQASGIFCGGSPQYGGKLFYPYLKTSSLQRDFLFASGSDESGCEADMLEGAEVGRHSPPRPQQEPINLKNEVSTTLHTCFI
ncbi:hypothetical protein B5X24_HaOG211186 [Helicoverpa armigera]|nr:hypothetical protein B5X24_HaOG211186 [Helicoverpa armigera]